MRAIKGRIAWALTLIGIACAVQESTSETAPDQASAPEPPPLTVNHALHIENGLECSNCHDPEDKGEPGPPPAEFCFECHDDLENAEDRIKNYFVAAKQGEEYVWPRWRGRTKDLIYSHASHVGSYGVKCEDCHGEASGKPFLRRAPLEIKATCFDCHQQRGADAVQCAICHVATRQDRKPVSHDAAFQRAHGRIAPEGWKDGGTWREPSGGTCALCHVVPDGCSGCHSSTKPKTHHEAGFRLGHGRGYLDAGVRPFEDSSCSLCHQENSCVRCHQTTKPRNHTLSWQRRFHGIEAEVDRTRCFTCHRQDFCTHCHETTQPVSHRGNFARGAQSHCVACHEPLTATGCNTCHKNTRGHLTAPPRPPGPPHDGASDCRLCHRALRHFDDGTDCRRCHR